MARNSSGCEQRDGYVGKWLTEEERGAFEAHLLHCPDCRQFVQEQEQLDRLLTRAHGVLLLVPAGLVEKVDVENKRVVVRADRKQIENAPEFDAAQPLEDPQRSVFGNYFHSLMEELTGRSRQRAPAQPRRASGRARSTRGSARATPAARSQSSSRTRRPPSDEPTKEELYEQAKKLDVDSHE